MAASKGNDFWKKRSKHGRDVIFADPNILWLEACRYFRWVDSTPLYNVTAKVVDKAIEMAEEPVRRPYSWIGLTLFCGIAGGYFRNFKLDPIKCHEGFMAVISAIDEIIRDQKFEGAAVGHFNANIISRDLGLADKMINTNVNYNSLPLDKDNVKKIASDLEGEV